VFEYVVEHEGHGNQRWPGLECASVENVNVALAANAVALLEELHMITCMRKVNGCNQSSYAAAYHTDITNSFTIHEQVLAL
jgi:hypothetical protein